MAELCLGYPFCHSLYYSAFNKVILQQSERARKCAMKEVRWHGEYSPYHGKPGKPKPSELLVVVFHVLLLWSAVAESRKTSVHFSKKINKTSQH